MVYRAEGIIENFKRIPEEERDAFIQRFPLLHDRMRRYQAPEVATQPTQQTQQIEQPGLSDIGKNVAQTVAQEGIKEGAKQGIGSLFGSSGGGATAATQTAFNSGAMQAGGQLATNAAQNAAYNAAATNAGGGLSAGTTLGSTAAGVGGVVAGANVVDALGNFDSRRGKGAIESTSTLIGTTLGGVFGGFAGAGIGSVAGRTIGRGLASLAGSAGWVGQKSHKQYAEENYGNALKAAKTDADKEFVQNFYQHTLGEIDDVNGTKSVYQEGPLVGRKWNWQDVKNVMPGSNLTGELGFIQAFPDWVSGFTAEQRNEIAQAALDHDLLTHASKSGRIFSEKEGDMDAIQEIALQVKEGTYEPLYTEEERYEDRQEYLQMLFDTEGYESPDLGKPFVEPVKEREEDGTDDDDLVQETSTVEEQRGKGSRRPLRKPPKFNEVPEAPKPEPTIRTPKDYAQAYLNVYAANTGRY